MSKQQNQSKQTDPQIFCSGELVEVGKLKPHPDNPNFHPDSQIELLSKIIRENGMRAPVVVSKLSGYIIKGHARLAAAKRAGLRKIPVDFQDYDDRGAELADMLADNRISELAELDLSQANQIIDELEEMEMDLDLTGFDAEGLENILLRTDPEDVFDDDPPGDSSESDETDVVIQCGEYRFKLQRGYYLQWIESVKKEANFDKSEILKMIQKRLKIQSNGVIK